MSAMDDFTPADLAQWIGSDSSYDQPRTSATVTSDLLAQGQSVQDSGSSWAGWFQGLGTTLIGYSLARDANKQRAQQYQAGATVPLYSARNGTIGINPVMLIGLGLIAVLVLKK